MRDVAKPSIESNPRLTHSVHGCCDSLPGVCDQLRIFVYCLLEDRYSTVAHCSLVVCQNLRLIIQHSLGVRDKAEPLDKAAHVFFIIGVVMVRTATLAAGSSRVVRFCGALLLTIGRLVWGRTDLFPRLELLGPYQAPSLWVLAEPYQCLSWWECWLHPQIHPWPGPSKALQSCCHLFPFVVPWLMVLVAEASCSYQGIDVLRVSHGWPEELMVRLYGVDLGDCGHPCQGNNYMALPIPNNISDP